MYKLLLVDDEPEIREGLQEVVPFEELGFTVVGEAGNGLDALQAAEELRPDVIITDIRMPLMDGLTLCRKVRGLLPATQFIILSGYDDFEYARQAMAFKALGYLLKPISSKEFIQMLRDTRITLDEAARQRLDVDRLRERFRASLPLLRQSLMTALLSGGLSSEAATRHAARYEEDIQAPAYAVFLAHIGEETGPERIGDPELMPFAVSNIMSEVLGVGNRTYLFRYNGQVAGLMLLEEDSPEAFAQGLDRIEEARAMAAHYLHCELAVGVSTACLALSRLPAAALQAASALDHAVLSRAEHALCVADVQQGSSTDLVMDDYQLRRLTNLIKVGAQEQAQEQLAQVLAPCRQQVPEARAYQTYLMELFMGFWRVLADMGLERADFNEDFDHISKSILTSVPAVEEAQATFTALLNKLISSIDEGRQSAGRLLADRAQQYLTDNFHREDLSLEDLCLHLHVSTSYFSAVFKRETKKTFHQALTALRMDTALHLLSQGRLRTSQVAGKVGLPDPSYFSYCFKKHFGFPPSQARGRAPAP